MEESCNKWYSLSSLVVGLQAVPVMTSSIFVLILLPCAESRLNSIRSLKTDENGPEVENGKQLLANEFLKKFF